MKITFFIAVLLIVCTAANAQNLTIPQPSTLQKIEQGFGLGNITLTYSRPNTKGRKIFNGMEPYGLVWRTGANFATKIKFTDTCMVEGHTIPAGEYSLFTIPGSDKWTVIFNKTAVQWGAYSYDSTKDFLRFTVKPWKLDKKVETLTMQFANTVVDSCELQIMWENTAIAFHFTTDVDAQVMANIAAAMKGEKKPWYQAAIYYYNHNKDMHLAYEWIKEFDKATPDAYNAKYWKARIEVKLKDKAAAIQTANEGLKLAKAEPNAEYIRLCSEVLAEANKL